MLLEDVLPEELIATLKSPEFDDEAGILIESVDFNTDKISISFSIKFGSGATGQLWKIDIEGVKEEKIGLEWAEFIEFYDEHPLLLEYNDIQSELYFTGATNNPRELYFNISQRLFQYNNDVESMYKYLILPDEIVKLNGQQYGLFSRGPKTILDIYKACLTEAGIKSNFTGEYKMDNNQNLKLFKLGESYVIATNFFFERIES
jgi:hypothetical protein